MNKPKKSKAGKQTEPRQCVCLRCGWGKNPGEWIVRKKNGKPARCPKCFSPAWGTPPNHPTKCHCKRCGWDWCSNKKNGKPLDCPHCGSRLWNTSPAPKPISLKPPGIE